MVFMIGIEFIPLSNRGIEMKIIYTENVGGTVNSILNRVQRRNRGAWDHESVQFGSPEDYCNQLLESERHEKLK